MAEVMTAPVGSRYSSGETACTIVNRRQGAREVAHQCSSMAAKQGVSFGNTGGELWTHILKPDCSWCIRSWQIKFVKWLRPCCKKGLRFAWCKGCVPIKNRLPCMRKAAQLRGRSSPTPSRDLATTTLAWPWIAYRESGDRIRGNLTGQIECTPN